MKTIIDLNSILSKVSQKVCTGRSAWNRGVALYAMDLVKDMIEENETGFLKLVDGKVKGGYTVSILNQHFDMWVSFSRGGLSLIYNQDIAERLCTPSELKKTHNGDYKPNRRESWLEVQGRALYQAAALVRKAIREEIAA